MAVAFAIVSSGVTPAAAIQVTTETSSESSGRCSYNKDHTVTGAITPGGVYDPNVYGTATYRCRQSADSYAIAVQCTAIKGRGESESSTSTCTKTQRAYVNGDVECHKDFHHDEGDGQSFQATCPEPI